MAISAKSQKFKYGSDDNSEICSSKRNETISKEVDTSMSNALLSGSSPVQKDIVEFENSGLPFDSAPFEPRDDSGTLQKSSEQLVQGISSKDWKLRKESYGFVLKSINNIHSLKKSSFDSNDVLPGLNNMVVNFVKDPNAAALDAALETTLAFAECCNDACDSTCAAAITSSTFFILFHNVTLYTYIL